MSTEAWEHERSEVKYRIRALEEQMSDLKSELAHLKDFIHSEMSGVKVELGKLVVKAGIWGIAAGAVTAVTAVLLTWLKLH